MMRPVLDESMRTSLSASNFSVSSDEMALVLAETALVVAVPARAVVLAALNASQSLRSASSETSVPLDAAVVVVAAPERLRGMSFICYQCTKKNVASTDQMNNGANDHTTECKFMRRLRQTLAKMELRVACVRKKESGNKKVKDG
jgi:hypothetical protein